MSGGPDLARRADFSIGHSLVKPSVRTIDGPTGRKVVEPRVMQVLIALYDANGAVLSRDDLLESCWDGVIVGNDAINRAVAEIRRASDETGAEIAIETIPRVGYRLAPGEGADGSSLPTSGLVGASSRRSLLLKGGIGAALAVGLGGFAAIQLNRKAKVDDLIAQGTRILRSGNPDAERRAEALFRLALNEDPDRADAWGWLARALVDDGKAREAAMSALDIDPDDANARIVLIIQQRDAISWADWEDSILAVLKHAPTNTLALDNLSQFYQAVGRCRDSWTTNERSFSAEPFNPSNLYRRAFKNWIFGRLGEADRIADQALRLMPRDAYSWNARLTIYAFTDRASAALALLNDPSGRPADLTPNGIESWGAALRAIETRSATDIAQALKVCSSAAKFAPGLAANAIMTFSYLDEVDAAFEVSQGLFQGRGQIIQESRRSGNRDTYASFEWGRTQFVFTPAMAAFRADPRFVSLCENLGHLDYWRQQGVWPDPFVRGAIDPAQLR